MAGEDTGSGASRHAVLRQSANTLFAIPQVHIRQSAPSLARPPDDESTSERCAQMLAILKKLEEKRAAARLGGGQKRIDAQHAKGKLTARERVEVLLDEASFEELDMYVEHNCTDFGMDQEHIPG